MLKRPKTENEGDEGPPPRRIFVAGSDDAACTVYADVLATFGFETECGSFDTLVPTLRDRLVGCAVVVGTDTAESSALKQVDAMRHSDHTQVRRTAIVLLTSSRNRQLFAWESGIDGFIVMPAQADEIAAEVDTVLARPRLERYNHRQAVLDGLKQS